MLRHSLLVSSALLLSACSQDELWGPGRGPEAEASTPAGVQKGEVTIVFTLAHPDATETDVRVRFSTNGGASFRDATEVVRGSGTSGLSVSPAGMAHTFVWDSGADVGEGRFEDVIVRISPESGRSGSTDPFRLNNTVFLATSYIGANDQGRIALSEVDLPSGALRVLRSVAAGGSDPRSILYRDGVFYVALESSNAIAAFDLDEEGKTLVALEGSPWSTGGIGPRWMAFGSSRLYVSNATGGTVSVFAIDSEKGSLTLEAARGIAAPGCRGLAVRGDVLYVASESGDSILVFDIEEDGLVENAFSPFATAGLGAPRTVGLAYGRLFVAENASAEIHSLRFLGGGELVSQAASPFSLSGGGIEAIAAISPSRLALAGSAPSALLVADVDANGAVAELAASPSAAAAPVVDVAVAGTIAILATSTANALEVRQVSSAGALSDPVGAPEEIGGEVRGVAVSD